MSNSQHKCTSSCVNKFSVSQYDLCILIAYTEFQPNAAPWHRFFKHIPTESLLSCVKSGTLQLSTSVVYTCVTPFMTRTTSQGKGALMQKESRREL